MAVADSPPIVTDGGFILFRQVLPGHYDVVTNFIHVSWFLLGSLREEYTELLPGRFTWILQCDETDPKPPGISIRGVIEVVIWLLFTFDPFVRNKGAELISEGENAI